MDLDPLTFHGDGVAANARPVLEASAEPTSGSVPLTVDFSASATDPEGTPVTLEWDFGVAGAPTATTGTASYTYAQRGLYTATVTATDADGRSSVRRFAIEVLPQCGNTATDGFDGTALDRSVWTNITREDASGYRVQDGSLIIDAVAGDMYGGNTSAENIIAQPAPGGAWTATSEVNLDHAATWEQAGMLLYTSDEDFLKLAFINTPDGRNIEFIRQRNGSPDDQGAADRSPMYPVDASDTVFLRMHSDGASVTAAYSTDGSTWFPVGRTRSLDGLTDPVIGVSAFNGVGTPASFNWFTLVGGGDAGRGPDDEFDGSELDACRWSTILREDASGYRVADGALQIDAVDGDMYGGNTSAENVILQSAPDGAWEAVTKLALPEGEEFEQAGLFVHASDADFAKLVLIDVPNQGWRVEFGQNLDGQPVFDEALDRTGALPAGINESGIWLRVRSDGSFLSGAWSADGETWTKVGRPRSLAAMPDPWVGLAAYNGNGQAATFDFFRLDEIDVQPPCQTGATPDDGYRMLFDGTAESLAQWKMAGPGGFQLQPDCSILSAGGLGLLYHPEAFESYSLKLDWKMAGDDNAGVFVGFPNPGTNPFNAVDQGHEIQIDATDDPSHTTGAIYGFQAAVTAARDAVLNPPGDWNSYEIVVQGDRIQVFLNGVKINDYADTDPNRMNAPSLIGLQNHGTGDEVFFRDVQINEIETPDTTAPALEVTSPENGSTVDSGRVTVTGTTNGTEVQLRAGTAIEEVEPTAGTFTATVPVQLGSNTINITAYNAEGVPTAATITVLSRGFGERVGGFTDPEGDDDGPGTYRYPTNSAFAAGGFDLTAMEVFTDGDSVRFVTQINGAIVNPWGGDHISHQRVNIYLGAGDGEPVAALPGTNIDTASPWRAAVVIDGRFATAGVYAPDGTQLSGGTLSTLPQTREIIITVPRSALGDLDLATARYGTAMFGNAEAGEGIGYVRPVYDVDYWQNPGPDMWWITEYRFGGGAGVWTDAPNHDSDTRDPNAMDVIVGPGQSQAEVLHWQSGSPTRLPMLGLQGAPDTAAPTVTAALAPAEPDGAADWYRSPVTITLEGQDDRPEPVALEYRLDIGEWTAYAEPVVVEEDGEHTIEYRATDAADNISEIGSTTFAIDTTPAAVAAHGVADGAAYGDSTTRTVSWTTTDATSGVASTSATLDGETITSGSEIRLWELELGEHALVVEATDEAGNVTEEGVTFTVETSLEDLAALVDRFRGDGRMSKGAAIALQRQIDRAEKAVASGDTAEAVDALEQFVKLVGIHVEDGSEVAALLERDARALIAAMEE
jgi:PKD repeat protein